MDEKDGMAETDGASVLDFLPLPLPAMTPVGEEESKRAATNAEVKNVDLTMVEWIAGWWLMLLVVRVDEVEMNVGFVRTIINFLAWGEWGPRQKYHPEKIAEKSARTILAIFPNSILPLHMEKQNQSPERTLLHYWLEMSIYQCFIICIWSLKWFYPQVFAVKISVERVIISLFTAAWSPLGTWTMKKYLDKKSVWPFVSWYQPYRRHE